MKVLIFGGKFNPLHNGHIKILQKAKEVFSFDEIWLLPSGLTKEQKILSDNNRILILNSFAKNNNLIVKDCELNVTNATPTINTLKNYNSKFEHDFSFLIGTDQANNFHTWDNAIELVSLANFIVATRKGCELINDNINKFNMTTFECDAPMISSTQTRRGDLSHLNNEIIEFLHKDRLFMKSIIKRVLSPKRAQHSINVALKAIELGKKYLPNREDELFLAGLFHDITKEVTTEQQKKLLSNPKLLSEHENTWHQYTGSDFVKNKLLIKNKDILSSIQKHTTGSIEMSLFDKIIFCADKISDERDYEEVGFLKEVAQRDIHECFVECYKASLKLLETKNIQLTEHSLKIKEKWNE